METHPAYDENTTTDERDDYWSAEYDRALTANVDNLESGSVRYYLVTMVAEYTQQLTEYDAEPMTDPDVRQAAARARAKRDAYADALRVLNIAADSAYDRATRLTGQLS